MNSLYSEDKEQVADHNSNEHLLLDPRGEKGQAPRLIYLLFGYA